MKLQTKQCFEDYLYLQKYVIAQTPTAKQGRLQVKLARIFFIFTVVSGLIFLITASYFSAFLFLIIGIFFLNFSHFLRWLLKINIKKNYEALLNANKDIVNVELQIDEGRFEFVQGATTFSCKTMNLKQYVETNEALIINIDGVAYCAVFKKDIEKWSAFVTEMKRYASFYKTPYTMRLSWDGNPFKKIKEE